MRLTRALFDAAWVDDRDISEPAVLKAECEKIGLSTDLVDRAGSDPELKQTLRKLTDEAVEKGLCGAPSFVVGGIVFWGQDRLGFVEKALGGWRPRAG